MYFYATMRSPNCSLKKGISIVEFVGCLAALGGGGVLGSMYLGVDITEVAYKTLERADIQIPAILGQEVSTSEPSPTTTTALSESNEPSDQLVLGPAHGTTKLNSTPAAVVDVQGNNAQAAANKDYETSEAEQREATQVCWDMLTDAVETEANNRTKSNLASGNWQLFDYLRHRIKCHEAAVQSIEQIDLLGVDSRLRLHVTQVLAWHRQGSELFDLATELLSEAPAGNLSGPSAQSWQSASTQHRMEEKLILGKHKAVTSYLQHAYKAADADTSVE